MNRILTSCIAALLFTLSGKLSPAQGADETTADFFVAVEGNDDWSGKLSEPNAARTDGPLATPARARDAVREFKKTSKQKRITVRIRGGIYRLKETLVFSLADAAPAGGTISYAAYAGEKPVLSSGVPITGWHKLEDHPAHLSRAAQGKIWVADLPPELDGCLTLYDGAERLPRARSEGFGSTQYGDKKTSAPDKLFFPPEKLRAWPDLSEGELLVIPSANYEMNILPLAAVDEINSVATTTVPASRPMGIVKFHPVSAWVENVLAVLDQPGEWAVNTGERKIYYWPRSGSPGREIVAPKLTELVRVEGAVDYDGSRDTPVTGLVFHGLTFSHAERYRWHGYTGWALQHHWEMFDRPTAALRFRGAEGCVVQACRFTATSGAGVRLDLHCQNIRLADNEIGHVGGVGILLAGYGPGKKDVNRQNVVSNNWVHHTGEIYWATPAVMIWQSGENHVANNLIHNTPYSGITVSTRTAGSPENLTTDNARTTRWAEVGDTLHNDDWATREKFLHARNNRVEQNDIHHVMEVMGDGDGIYISGTGGGNLIRQNYIHECDSDAMADGIRCDDDQHETIIESNIIARTRCIGQGICSKGRNHILNNVIADLRPSGFPIVPARVTRAYIGLIVNPVTGSRIERNILVSRRKDYPIYTQKLVYGTGGEPRLRDCQADYNLYYCTEDPAWAKKHLQTEQAFGVERHSISADPLFVNLEKGDLRLQPESPAWKLGFQKIDLTSIGLRPGHPYHQPAK
jgi:hypothetical protein